MANLSPLRELDTFLFAPVVRAKLSAAGFCLINDLQNLQPSKLSQETGISLDEAVEVLRMASGEGDEVLESHSALELLERELSLPNIVTFCRQLDDLLGGGIALRQITEVCGAPGVGKTQLCIQLAVDTTIPECMGGVGGEAVYIDTEGSFILERVADIANATAEHCQRIAAKDVTGSSNDDLAAYTMEKILQGVHVFRCHDYVELLATVHTLSSFVSQHPKVRLVVVDSIAFPFRHNVGDLSRRTHLLMSMAQSCITLANDRNLATGGIRDVVVRTTHNASKRGGGGGGGPAREEEKAGCEPAMKRGKAE